MSGAPVQLDPASIEAVAQRVAELLHEARPPDELIDAAEVARRLGVSRDHVYRHAAELGAIPLGSGDKARLRFDPEKVVAAMGNAKPAVAPKRRPHPPASGVGLLPIQNRSPGDHN